MKPRVLAVEDSPTQAAWLETALVEGGYEVSLAGDGEEALRILEAERVDVVVSDVLMPGSVDGYELCRRVKAGPAALPVVLLTSLTDPMDVIRGLEAGADNFLTKPYEPDHLRERLDVLLATRRGRERSRVQAGVHVHFMGRQVTITAEREQILDLLVSTFEDAVLQNRELRRREREMSRARERLAGMYRIAVALNASGTSEREVVDAALDGAVRLPGVRAAWLSLREGEAGFRVAGSRHLPPTLREPGALEGDCRCRRLLVAGELRQAAEVVECERLAERPGDAFDLRHHATVPLHYGDRSIGVLNLLGEGAGLFDEDDRAVLYGIGSQLGSAIERVRVWRDLERVVEERTAALRASEERYRTLVEEVNDGFFVADARGTIAFANRALAAIHGIDDPKGLVGRSLEELVPEAERGDVMARLLGSDTEGAEAPLITTPVLGPEGSRAVVEIRPAPVLEGGRLAGVRGVVRDVTERVRAQEALRLSDSILRRIGNLVLVADRNGLIRYASPSVEQMLGYRTDEVLGEGWWHLPWAEPPEREREREAFERRVRGEDAVHEPTPERPLRARDETVHWLLWTESEGPEGLAIRVGYDTTERRTLQEQLLHGQKLEAVGRLAGGIAHDFNNVLTTVLTTAELLLADLPGDAPTRDDVLVIREAGRRAATFTRQLLAFGRKQVLEPRVVNLNEVVGGMEAMLARLLGEDVEVDAHLEAGLDNVRVDPGQVEQVVMNLAVNARDAMPDGGRLVIETRNVELDPEYVRAHAGARSGAHVLLVMSDTGHGMDEATRTRVFEPFFTTKERSKGTGLGLATVHGIVHQSGGRILLYSEPGQGTTFKIYLPAVQDAVEPDRPARSEDEAPSGTETILLVEDDDAIRAVTERILRRAGYTVHAAADGREALATLREAERPVHLALTDVVMPGMGVAELVDGLRDVEPGIRVLYMSGYTDEVIGRQGLLESGGLFIEKPFTVEALRHRVREALDAPAS